MDVGAGGGDATAELLSRRAARAGGRAGRAACGPAALPVRARERATGVSSCSGTHRAGVRRRRRQRRRWRRCSRRTASARSASPGSAPTARLRARRATAPRPARAQGTIRRPSSSFPADHASAGRARRASNAPARTATHVRPAHPPGRRPRCGGDPVAAERFAGPGLPAAWSACGGRPFRANIIAYHVSHARDDARRVDPVRFLCDYQVLKSQDLLVTATAGRGPRAAPIGMFGVIGAAFRIAPARTGSPAREQLRWTCWPAGGRVPGPADRPATGAAGRPGPGARPRPRSDLLGIGFGRSAAARRSASRGPARPAGPRRPAAGQASAPLRLTDALC